MLRRGVAAFVMRTEGWAMDRDAASFDAGTLREHVP
jgi:hypothetical protein